MVSYVYVGGWTHKYRFPWKSNPLSLELKKTASILQQVFENEHGSSAGAEYSLSC